jgi:predicted P-loop ATPase
MAIRLRFLINEQFSFLPSNDLLTQILTDIASQNRYHPVRDYLNGLVWDGVPRIGNWLIRYAGAEDTDFNKAAGRIFLLAGVRRVRLPGVKFDTVLVFESVVQGQNKSTALRILAIKDEWFSDNLQLGASAKESIEGTQGIWIVEFGELSGMQRRDRDQILTFLSRQDDRARVAYGRRAERFPRQFIAAATTNKTEYLSQEERRILPVAIKKFDLEALRRDRDQLWAEAAHYEAQGETISLPERLWKDAAEVRKNRRQENPFIAVLAEYLEKLGHPDTVTPAQIWEALGETSKRLDGTIEQRPIPVERRAKHCTAMGEAMAELGYARRRDKSRGANRDKIYYEKEPGLGLGG